MRIGDLTTKNSVPCAQCPLRKLARFRSFTPEQLAFVASFKVGELTVERGATFVNEGSNSAHLYTVLDGWAFRYKTLPDGRRQILNYVLPGDFIGLQGSLMNESQHSVEALTPMTLCLFERERIWELYSKVPSLAFDITWLAAREEQMLDDHLLAVGRRTAQERVAFLFLHLFSRAEELGATRGNQLRLPLTQQHVADTLGLSLVHTNKTIRKLAARGMIRWQSGTLSLTNRNGAREMTNFESPPDAVRPFI